MAFNKSLTIKGCRTVLVPVGDYYNAVPVPNVIDMVRGFKSEQVSDYLSHLFPDTMIEDIHPDDEEKYMKTVGAPILERAKRSPACFNCGLSTYSPVYDVCIKGPGRNISTTICMDCFDKVKTSTDNKCFLQTMNRKRWVLSAIV
jgi:hypothetical protein